MQPAPPSAAAQVVPVQHFVQGLSDCGLLSADEIKAALAAMPPEHRQG